MRILTSTIIGAGLMFGTATLAQAQLGGLKDIATKAATDRAKDVATSSAPGSITSTDLSTSETITAGKVILGGGSTTDAAIAVGRSRIESRVNDQVEKATSDPASFGSSLLGNRAETPAAAPAQPAPVQSGTIVTTPAAPAVSCPAGTTAQPNGTCMVTGNWGS